MDAVETIVRSYILLDKHEEGFVGKARSYIFDGNDIVKYGISYLERNFG